MDPGGPFIIAYDGSEDAHHAIAQAGEVLGPRAAIVVTVWPSPATAVLHGHANGAMAGAMAEAAAAVDEGAPEAAQQTAEEGASLAKKAGFDARPLAAEGVPIAWPTLVDIAEAQNAAGIIAGRRGLSAIKSLLLGSTSAGLLRQHKFAALVVPLRNEVKPAKGPILLAYDETPAAERALEYVSNILPRSQVLVATVWSSAKDVAPAAALAIPSGGIAGAQVKLDEELQSKATTTAEGGAEAGRSLGLLADPLVEQAHGNTWSTLVHLADDVEAAAIVLGSHGRSAPARLLLGSVSLGVAEHATRPVIVVPPSFDE